MALKDKQSFSYSVSYWVSDLAKMFNLKCIQNYREIRLSINLISYI